MVAKIRNWDESDVSSVDTLCRVGRHVACAVMSQQDRTQFEAAEKELRRLPCFANECFGRSRVCCFSCCIGVRSRIGICLLWDRLTLPVSNMKSHLYFLGESSQSKRKNPGIPEIIGLAMRTMVLKSHLIL